MKLPPPNPTPTLPLLNLELGQDKSGNDIMLNMSYYQDDIFIHIGVWGAIITKQGACFTPGQWVNFVRMYDNICCNLQALVEGQKDIAYLEHIGGGLYVSIDAPFKCVQFRHYYSEDGDVFPSMKGVILKVHQFSKIAEGIQQVKLAYPAITTITPCEDTHVTDEQFSHCPECNPLGPHLLRSSGLPQYY